MNISNAFIRIESEPKDFNGFIDKLPPAQAEQKNFILKFIEKIIDKLFSISQPADLGKNVTKYLNKIVNESERMR